ncbi:AraC family transcriptional regulator [Flavobacterium rhamnosiphilum]|uniref:AraC family transcriptional regulator n=1 Tax=Flavobacterium rhamnosiphilum TaxID=2541724 RepID=A0A4V2Z9A1_9FLAO|nr:AraC family transcriptional regulator [Flavobacterium rhamnosiphilum]TDE43812.1 AraC family transcriptional regulator [Flavobacterium rhamnosiphilum]
MSDFNKKRIYNTRNYIETHYNQIISVDSLETISCYSYRNLQRIFYSLFNETIGAYQTRLKVENGYKKLLYSNKQISDIALEIGFADVQSFSKTFKKHFNCSPSLARNQKELLLNEGHPIQTITCVLKPEIIFIPEKAVYYSSCKTSYINPEIEILWDAILKNDFPDSNTEYYGVVADDIVITEKSKCTYDACIATSSLIKNLPTKSIFGGNYARFFHQGSYETLEETYQQIYGGWFLDNDFECSHSPVIEHYLKNEANCDNEADYLTAIFIPLL